MLDTSNSTNTFVRPKDAKEETSDLKLKEDCSDYSRRNIFKWFLLIISIIVISTITFCFLWKFSTEKTIQEYILNQILNNIVFIIVTIFAILKINVPNIKN